MASDESGEIPHVHAPREEDLFYREVSQTSFLLNWSDLVNRNEYVDVIRTNPALVNCKREVIDQALSLYRLQMLAKDGQKPATLTISDEFSANIFIENRRLFIDRRIPFASGAEKNFYHSIMIELDHLGNLRSAFLVAKAMIKDASKEIMDDVYERSMRFESLRRMEDHLAPVPFFVCREQHTLYYQLFNGDLVVFLRKIRDELKINGHTEFHQRHQQKFIYIVLEITRQLLHGVKTIHSNGFVHRDIKLANILFLGDLTLFRIVITDFDDMVAVDEARLDRQFLGTERYMSPQKRHRDIEYALAQTDDCYALGIVLWEIFNVFSDDILPVEVMFQNLLKYYGKNGEGYQNGYKGKLRQFAAKAHFADEIIDMRNGLYRKLPLSKSFESLIYGLTRTKSDRRFTVFDAQSSFSKRHKRYLNHFLKNINYYMQPQGINKLQRGQSTSYLEEEFNAEASAHVHVDDKKVERSTVPRLLSTFSESLLKFPRINVD